MKRLLTLLLITKSYLLFGQISPPGLGKAHTAEWIALGLRQDLNSKQWQSMSYLGVGRKSNPDDYNPMKKSAIWVLNEEVYYKFKPQWQVSLAGSLRRQDNYKSSFPFEHNSDPFKFEFRTYSRLSNSFQLNKLSLTPTIRQEYRKFYGSHFESVADDQQLRTRFRIQLAIPIVEEHKVTISSEQLWNATHIEHEWGNLEYNESRFGIYYSFLPHGAKYNINFGYMNNLVGKNHPYDVHYLSVDMVLLNPFN